VLARREASLQAEGSHFQQSSLNSARGKKPVINCKIMKELDFHSRKNGIAARSALPTIMRNGLSEECRELLRNTPVASDQEKEVRHHILVNGLFYTLHLNDKHKLMGRLTPVNFD
jgi:hypothetical protein